MAFGTWIRSVTMLTALATVAGAEGCAIDEAPGGVRRAVKTNGPTVQFDFAHKPLPNIPLPNDVATWPDPTSRTGRRINASLVAPTSIERNARSKFSQLEGWGTFAPIAIPFDKPLDAEDIKAHHADDDFKFEDDVVYLVNLKTGVPVPLDLGGGNFPVTLRELARYWPNDPRKGEANILFETVDEDKNGNGLLDPGEDTDFDGVLDKPNFPGGIRPGNGVDGLYTFYEAETHTLLARPMFPLDEQTEYAVVVTDRLHGLDKDGAGKPRAAQSPFAYIHHPSQRASVERLAAVMSQKKEYYGFAGDPLEHVQFVFTFTTQPTVSDMFALRDGAYGKGKFGWIGRQYKPEIKVYKAVGRVESDDADPPGWEASTDACKQQGDQARSVARYTASFRNTLSDVAAQLFGIDGPAGKRLVESFDYVDYLLVGSIKVPWLLGDLKDVSPEATIRMDHATGEIPHSDSEVPFLVVVPKRKAGQKGAFPVTFYGHGYGSSMTEALGFAGELARHGVATIGMNAPGHGLELSDGQRTLAKALFGGACLTPFASAFTLGRVRDLNGDGQLADESGADYWTSYLFHTRDVVRQAAFEEVMLVRAMREFDGIKAYDWAGDGKARLAGDFDGDGQVDFGGPNGRYFAWGGSLGGILSSLAGAVDPHITATAPMAGGGALTDVGIRSFQGGVVEAIDLRMMGPLLVSVPAEARFEFKKNADGKVVYDDRGQPIPLPKEQQPKTACDAGQMSIRWVTVDLASARELEVACADRRDFDEGYDVVVGNMTSGEVRCARVTVGKTQVGGTVSDSGKPEFRVGIPASVGDEIVIASYKPPPGKAQAVLAYGDQCTLPEGLEPVRVLRKWEGVGQPCKTRDARCVVYQSQEYPVGSKLVSVSEGFGLRRQSPELRRLMTLAQIALDPADPVSFAPYYYTRPRRDENGAIVPPAGIYTINTIGDMNVPVNTGIAAARIHGAIPFLRPENAAAKDYPDYVAPQALIVLVGDTPNKVLLKNHVVEGIRWLERHPAPGCLPNTNNAVEGCRGATSYDASVCRQALFDPDYLDEGANPVRPQHPAVPLRLVRLAKPATASDLAATWGPRLAAAKGGWTAGATLAGVVNAFIVPEGVHGFDPPDPCKQWDTGMFLSNMVGRFFATGATDVPYATNPSGYKCAAVTDPKAPSACVWK